MALLEKNNFAKKLLYLSQNRGMRENELILGKFAKVSLKEMSLSDMADFEVILQENDGDLYEWLTHKSPPPERLNFKIMRDLLKFNIND